MSHTCHLKHSWTWPHLWHVMWHSCVETICDYFRGISKMHQYLISLVTRHLAGLNGGLGTRLISDVSIKCIWGPPLVEMTVLQRILNMQENNFPFLPETVTAMNTYLICKMSWVICPWLLRPNELLKPSWHSVLIGGGGAGPAGTAAAGPILEAKLMNCIKGRLQKFWLSNNLA